MLHDFLVNNRDEILALTESKTLRLAGSRPSSIQLQQGLPIFFEQLLGILALRRPVSPGGFVDEKAASQAASLNDEPALARAGRQPQEAAVATSAGLHGAELMRLGYTLSHVVHAYGAMCQAITELATQKESPVTTAEFHDLNQCLDVAIAGAVTQFQSLRDTEINRREVEHLGFLAHEMRNALTSASISFQVIRKGTVGASGSTAQVVESSLKRIQDVIDRSLTEVRLRIDPEVRVESSNLLQFIDQILVTAEVEASSRGQKINVNVDPHLVIQADQQAFYSALSNLIQNALKYTHAGGTILIRAAELGAKIAIEVEDECGGLLTDRANDLFKPYVQKNENRSGLGLGLTIAERAIKLNHGRIEARNLPGKGCVFTITLPREAAQGRAWTEPAA